MKLKGNVRTLIMRRGRAAWVWVMFQMSLLHPSSHTPPVSTRHSGQYIWRFTAHSAILSLLLLLHLCPGESYLTFPVCLCLGGTATRSRCSPDSHLNRCGHQRSSSYCEPVEPAKKDLSHNWFICILPPYRRCQIPEGL